MYGDNNLVETDKWFVLCKLLLFKRHVLLVVGKHAYLAVTVGPSVFHSRRLGEGWV